MRKSIFSLLFWLCCATGAQAAGSGADVLLSYSDGGHYLGALSEGERNGQGAYLYPDYSLYIGEWQAGRKQGHGLFKWPNGNIFQGQWRQGVMHGDGVLTFADGGVHRGRWDNGELVENAEGPADDEPSGAAPADAEEARCAQVQEIETALREISARLQSREQGSLTAERADVQTWGIDQPCR
jgi:hypothetical protein